MNSNTNLTLDEQRIEFATRRLLATPLLGISRIKAIPFQVYSSLCLKYYLA